MYITIKDLLIFLAFFIGFCLITAVSVYNLVILSRINKLIGNANRVVENNENNITKTIAALPVAIENINGVVLDIKGGIKKAENTIDTVEMAVTETVSTVSGKTDNLLTTVNTAITVAEAVIGYLSKPSKK